MKFKSFHSIKEIDKGLWDSLDNQSFPFCSWNFLSALEESGSIGERTGWYPLYITLTDDNGLVGALYLFIKSNSYGEYIFDWAWADAWQKAGIPYFPKLTSAVPFTPATGPKILIRDSEKKQFISKQLLKECLRLAEKLNIQTTHFLFIPEEEIPFFEEEGFSIRKTCQYHWKNEGYSDFEGFLAALKQKKRKEIRRERKLLDKSLKIHQLTGSAVIEHARLMYSFYLSTIDKKWSQDYLTEEFFTLVFESMNEHILLYLAEDQKGRFIAGTLNFHMNDKLYGRYWGCTKDIPHLHFELCYYRPLEFAINNGIRLFEAGAQGEHKVQRGFIPSFTYSAHFLPDHQLGDAVKDYLKREAYQMENLVRKGRSFAFKEPSRNG
jgi:predicted N-acyltransferase